MDITEDGKTPIYSADTTNNGIIGYCNKEPNYIVNDTIPLYLIFGDHTRTMNIVENSFCIADNVKVLIPKYNSIKILLYISTVWKKAIPNLGYARHWTKAKNVLIILPTKTNGLIDLEFIEKYISELEEERISEVAAYLKVSGLDNYELSNDEKNLLNQKPKVKEFLLEDVFTSQTGDVDLQQKDINGKGTCFINSGSENNGIKGKTDKIAKVFNENTITIDFWGLANYRSFKYKMATHNHVFSLSGNIIKNEKVGLYLVSQMHYFSKLFAYNNMGTWNKMKNLTISLPITDKNEIDFEYMENYITIQEKLAIKDVVIWKNKLINKTKDVIIN